MSGKDERKVFYSQKHPSSDNLFPNVKHGRNSTLRCTEQDGTIYNYYITHRENSFPFDLWRTTTIRSGRRNSGTIPSVAILCLLIFEVIVWRTSVLLAIWVMNLRSTLVYKIQVWNFPYVKHFSIFWSLKVFHSWYCTLTCVYLYLPRVYYYHLRLSLRSFPIYYIFYKFH